MRTSSSPPTTIRRRLANMRGFNLVEVVIALGIVAVAILPVIGLFGVGLSTARQSKNDTQLAIMVRSASDSLRAMPFTDLANPNRRPAALWFDTSGQPVPDNSADAIYLCEIQEVPTAMGDQAVEQNLFRYRLVFRSPPGNTGEPLAVLPASIAKHD